MSLRISLFAVLLILVGCRSGSGIPLIRSSEEYDRVALEAKELSVDILTRYDLGESLTAHDKAQLRTALDKFEGMRGFKPTEWGPYFGAAKVHMVFGEDAEALRLFHGCMINAPISDPLAKATSAEAAYLASQIHEKAGDYENAKKAALQAVTLVTVSANYYAQLGSAELQLKDEKAATKSVKKALELDPENPRALQLAKFMGILKPTGGA